MGARPGTAGAALEAVREAQARAGLDEESRAREEQEQRQASANLGYVEVQSVWAGSIAEQVGIRPGDRITRIGNVEIRGPSDMGRAMKLDGPVTVYGMDSSGGTWQIPDVPGPVCCMYFPAKR